MILKDSQNIELAVIAKTKKGHPAQIEGTPVWTSSNEAIAKVTAAEDGLSAQVSANTELGDAIITVKAQVMNKGVLVEKEKSTTATVVAGDGETLDIVEGPITEQA